MNNHGEKWFRGQMIGKGSYGSVFLATLKKPKTNFSHLPTVMAVKSAEVSVSGSLQKEKEVLDSIQGCPFVIHCFGEEITNNEKGEMIFNLLLEYASGGSLSDLIKKSGNGGLPESDIKRYTRSILRGLAHIHECGYVHCDLKPDNILLVPVSSKNSFKRFNYMAKIADFGLSKAVKQNKRGRWDIGLRGTPVYMAPETVLENIQGPQSDVWALGCVVFEMLTGKSIWDEDRNMGFEDICRLIGDENGLPEIPSGISRMGRNFLKACLVRKPMLRSSPEVLLDHPFVAGVDDEFWEDDESQELGLDLGSVMGENEDMPCYCSVSESEYQSDCSGSSISVEESWSSSLSGDFGGEEVLLVRKSAIFCKCGDHSFALPAQPLRMVPGFALPAQPLRMVPGFAIPAQPLRMVPGV